jgi:hypothetical protein
MELCAGCCVHLSEQVLVCVTAYAGRVPCVVPRYLLDSPTVKQTMVRVPKADPSSHPMLRSPYMRRSITLFVRQIRCLPRLSASPLLRTVMPLTRKMGRVRYPPM